MDYTLQLIFQIAAAVAMFVFVALNGVALFAIIWVAYHVLHDHWSMKQAWQHAKTRLSI
jgi:hypothetical protein